MGFQVLEAADGLEAVALFELRHKEITAVLMDLTMPHMDGRQAFLRMHQVDPNIPVVLTSGYSEQDAVAEASRCLACAVCSECEACVKACPAGAIELDQQEEIEELAVGAIIVATGPSLGVLDGWTR